jgi:hypothetical protein
MGDAAPQGEVKDPINNSTESAERSTGDGRRRPRVPTPTTHRHPGANGALVVETQTGHWSGRTGLRLRWLLMLFSDFASEARRLLYCTVK